MTAHRWQHGLLVLGSAGLLAACAALLSRAREPPSDQIRFSHARHAQAKVDCATCHDDVFDAKTLAEVKLPAEKKCLQCHADQKAKGNCAMCHSDVRFAGPFPKPEVGMKVSHAFHLEKFGEDCARCHKQLSEPVQTERPAPPMGACLDCHEHRREYDDARCAACHVDLTRYSLRPISSYTHQGNFVRTHGLAAHASAEACAQCHDQVFCQDCHASTVATRVELKFAERVDRQFIHRGDYVSRHSIEASAQSPVCERCHATRFCQDCHAVQNLTSNALNPRNPHPFGWNLPGSANFHGPAARRDITSCAVCHDQGPRSNCVECHKSGGIGGNPHPAGWNAHHDRQEIKSNGMCLACHR